MSDPASHDDARIYDQGYRPFDGSLASVRSRFWVISIHELRLAWKDKWFRRIVLGSFMPLVVFAVLTVIKARFSMMLDADLEIWRPFWGIQLFFAMLMVYFTGRNAVGEDLRSGALTVYFSRPVSFSQYLLGKWLAIAVAVLSVTLLPGFVLAVFTWLADPYVGALKMAAWTGGLALAAVCLCLATGWVMLAISSLTGRGRAAGIVWLILFFVSVPLAEGLARGAGFGELQALAFPRASELLTGYLLEGRGSLAGAAWMLLGQLLWAAAGATVVLFRLRRWVRA